MLSDYLYTLREINVFFNLFNYISFRAGISLVTSLFFVILLMPYWIKFQYKIFPLGQPIREDGPSTHLSKMGTPTFGGILIIISIIVSSILWTSEFSKFNYILILTLILFGFIGLYDDYQKVRTKKGISSINKFSLQILFTIIIYFSILLNGFDLDNFFIPFLKNISLELGFFYFFLILFVIIGSTNATNLTDGLDGLVSMPLIFVFLTFTVFAYILGNINFSNYLLINYIPGSGEIVIFCTSAIGAILGFLWFNSSPASIFMGDTGSQSLGASLAVTSILLKQEFVLAIAGGLFVIETLSVMIQVIFFKLTKGKRFFLMAPLHHHYEKKGLPEQKIVIRFWIISFLFCLLALSLLKIR
jgi:phospho-N-acetylmuramoyl-pentapeptide-transferase